MDEGVRLLFTKALDGEPALPAGEIAHGARVAGTDLHVVLMKALATLPVRDQAIVVLRHWEDQSVDAVAGILGVSVSVVKMQNARALSRLRAALGDDFIKT